MSAEIANRERALPLARHTIVSTPREGEAAAIISRYQVPLRIARTGDPEGFRLDMNGRQLGRLFVGYNRFATETELDAGLVEDAVVIALAHDRDNPSFFEIDGERVLASTGTAAVISPTRRTYIRRPSRAGVFVLGVSSAVLADRYRQLTGNPVRACMTFAPSVDLTAGLGRLLCEQIVTIVTQLDSAGSESEMPILASILEDSLISLILGLPGPHNPVTDDSSRRGTAPWVVARAEEFMAAHASDPIKLADLVDLCRCSESTLHNAFRTRRGYTPMQFLAVRRLELARDRLLHDPNTTATGIALDCGFGNQGRFAKAYRARFGELPSETRARVHGPTRR